MKILIIGEAPSKNEPLPRPIEGRIGRRLADFADVSFDTFLARTERMNLLAVRQDTAEKGFEFDHVVAAERAREVVKNLEPERVVLLLGKRVAKAAGIAKDYFIPCFCENGALIYVVPHPSGVNRWFNDPKNLAKMSGFMKAIINRS